LQQMSGQVLAAHHTAAHLQAPAAQAWHLVNPQVTTACDHRPRRMQSGITCHCTRVQLTGLAPVHMPLKLQHEWPTFTANSHHAGAMLLTHAAAVPHTCSTYSTGLSM
jgi:hypothetical protein